MRRRSWVFSWYPIVQKETKFYRLRDFGKCKVRRDVFERLISKEARTG